jgi:FecR protein/SPOR domain
VALGMCAIVGRQSLISCILIAKSKLWCDSLLINKKASSQPIMSLKNNNSNSAIVPVGMSQPDINLQRRQSTLAAAAWMAGRAAPLPVVGLGALAGLGSTRNVLAQNQSTAVVELLRAPAWLEMADRRIPLAAGAIVSALQTVVTGEGARVVLKFPEGSIIALGANSRLTIESLAYNQTASESLFNAAFKVAIGTFRYVTSLTEKLNGKNRRVSVSTATATIGIRGTRFWAQSNTQQETVCLFEGKVDIERANEPLAVLDAPNAFWSAAAGQAALPISIATPEQLRGFGGQVAAPEGSGLAKPGGSFRVANNIWLESRAKALAAQLAELGFVATVTPCASGSANTFDVTVGSLASADDARAVAAQLANLVKRNFELVEAAK